MWITDSIKYAILAKIFRKSKFEVLLKTFVKNAAMIARITQEIMKKEEKEISRLDYEKKQIGEVSINLRKLMDRMNEEEKYAKNSLDRNPETVEEIRNEIKKIESSRNAVHEMDTACIELARLTGEQMEFLRQSYQINTGYAFTYEEIRSEYGTIGSQNKMVDIYRKFETLNGHDIKKGEIQKKIVEIEQKKITLNHNLEKLERWHIIYDKEIAEIADKIRRLDKHAQRFANKTLQEIKAA